MTWMKFSFLGLVYTLFVALGVGAASGHEAHRKASSVTLEASDGDSAPQPAEGAHREPAAAAAAADSSSTREPYAPTEAPPEAEAVSVLDWLGRLHPMAIHFPIALFLASLVAELLFIATQAELFRHALRFCLWGGAMSAVVVVPLGWIFAASGATEEGWILEAHRWTGSAAAFLGLTVLWAVERAERVDGSRVLLRVLLAIQASLIGTVGFLGGSLLYGFDHLWRGF